VETVGAVGVHCSSNRDGGASDLAAALQRLCSSLQGGEVESHADPQKLRDF